jgi:hypothetical protein
VFVDFFYICGAGVLAVKCALDGMDLSVVSLNCGRVMFS